MTAVVNAPSVLTENQVPRGANGDDYSARNSSNQPTQEDFINIFGPDGANVKLDKNRFGRINRVHIPDVLRGRNEWMTERVDGLITDTTNSEFTTLILPYKYLETPDAKFKWNVWSFDEGLASRVPYESAARTLTQTRREFAGFTVRQGLAMTMEHNFMATPEGRTNFQNQLKQIVNSIQNTNELDVHMALINAPNYFTQVREKFYRDEYHFERELREYVDNFGFLQKNINGLDILIEDAKTILRGWGASEPDFMLLNSKLTFQITMMPEKTQYVTQGVDGVRRLREGPNITRYRGLHIVRSKAFSMEQGAAPRDLLRRRVRVAEFYLLPVGAGDRNNSNADLAIGGGGSAGPLSGMLRGGRDVSTGTTNNFVIDHTVDTSLDGDSGAGAYSTAGHETDPDGEVQLYDESCDSWCAIRFAQLFQQARKFVNRCNSSMSTRAPDDPLRVRLNDNFGSLLLLRPNIEHWMLGLIIGKGGLDDLGATLWGQTELSCFDDGQHGIWGMSYKYHEKAIVFNERNLIRIWDVAYDGYVGGKDVSMLDWENDEDVRRFVVADAHLNRPYNGPSLIVLPMPPLTSLPSPIPIGNIANPMFDTNAHQLATSDLFCEDMSGMIQRLSDKIGAGKVQPFKTIISLMFEQLNMNRNNSTAKEASAATIDNEATAVRMAYSGTLKYRMVERGAPLSSATVHETSGCGHHGPDFVGAASLRAGKGYRTHSQPIGTRIM